MFQTGERSLPRAFSRDPMTQIVASRCLAVLWPYFGKR